MNKIQEISMFLPEEWKLLEKAYPILLEGGVFDIGGKNKVVKFYQPNELKQLINFSIKENGEELKNIIDLCRKVIEYSVKTNHPHFHNQLFGEMDPFGLLAAWITEALNTSAYTFEVAPVFSLMETEIVQKICEIIGYKNCDGIFAPGGSISNMYAMVLARYKLNPEIKSKGISNGKSLVAFASEESHYSFKKAVHWLGIGTENLIIIKTNSIGQMIANDLEFKIQNVLRDGKIPFFVNANAGTTVLGSFDDFDAIANICEKFKLWLHIDACHGGGVILSTDNRYLIKGIEKSNSIAWDPHKALAAPLQCALFLTKEKGLLGECNSTDAKYLFQQDKFYDISYDTGNKSVQCGRKVDAFKLWLMFKARGISTYGLLIDHAITMSKLFAKKIKENKNFRLVQEHFQYTNICFWYIPKFLLGQNEDADWYNKLYEVAPKIKAKMTTKGSMLVGYTPLPSRNLGNFFRMVFTSLPPLTEENLDFLINEINTLGNEL